MSSRIAQLAIVDSLYIYLVLHKDKETLEAIKIPSGRCRIRNTEYLFQRNDD